MQYDVIILGGGTAGLFCAYEASKKGLRIALLEQKERLGEKLRLAGGGMGNMTNRSLNFQNNSNTSLSASSHSTNLYNISIDTHISQKTVQKTVCHTKNTLTQNAPETHYISQDTKEMGFILSSLFQDFSCNDVITLLDTFKIPYEEREFGQIFCLKPVKYFVETLVHACKNVDFYLNTLVKHVYYTNEDEKFIYHVRLDDTNDNNSSQEKDSTELHTTKLVIATGSSAYPQLGASDFGLRLAKKWGHSTYAFSPVLVPLTLESIEKEKSSSPKLDLKVSSKNKVNTIKTGKNREQSSTIQSNNACMDLSGLEGISLPVRMRVIYENAENIENIENRNKKTKKEFKKEFADPCDVRSLLFTHKGVSGPACLVASCFLNSQEQNPLISIDFLPYINIIDLMHATENGKKILKNLILPLLPDRLAYRLMPFDLQDKKVAELGKKQRQIIANQIHNALFYVSQNEGMKKAEAARGGICVKELTNNMESKQYNGLYFCGEVIDITGLLGGYNIHFALASAMRIARNL